MLGHFRLTGRLGAGGMGEVFRARDTKLDREVAVKLLPEAFTADPDRHARFHREARSMAAFSHPRVAAVHALEEHDGNHFLVMELVEGENLAELLARGALPVPRALQLARQMAGGIEAAHAAGIIHRDLKPANVMIDPAGDLKILDFGLAKVFAEDEPAARGLDDPTLTTDRTRAGVVLGTAAYMSPEQARGLAVDRRTDIWAFGAVLFEMLAGCRPFGGETVTDTLAAVLRSEPPWAALPPELPTPVARLLQRCLQKDPHRRLHDVADARIVLEDLDAADGPYGPTSPFAGLAGSDGASPSTRTHRPWLLLGLTVAACALAVWALWLRPAAEFEPPRARTLTYSGRDWSPTASPDGALVAFVSDRDGVARIWLKQLAGGGERPLTAGPDDMPRFSPDGSQILYAHDEPGGRSLFRVPVLGGAPRKVLDNAIEGDWSPDGGRVAFIRLGDEGDNSIQQLGIAPLQSGQERILQSALNVLWYGVRWSPDGRRIIVNSASLSGNVAGVATMMLVDAEDGTMRDLELTDRPLPFGAVSWAPSGDAVVVSQPTDLLSHVLGYPGLILESPVDQPAPRPVAWLPVRLPRGGWGFSSTAVLDRHRLVLDEQLTLAELWEVSLDADARPGEVRVLTSGLSRDRQPAYSPDGRTIVFSSNRSGNIDLWLCDRQSGELRQLTDDAASDWDPAFSADGQSLLWSSDRSGAMEIWMSAADGSGARRVTDDGRDAENPTLTPDGQWIVYASGNLDKLGIWKIRPEGRDAVLLQPGPYLLPEISPDGRLLLAVTTRDLGYQINVMRVDDGSLLPFAIAINPRERKQDLVLGRCRWTPDGHGVVYIGQDEEGRSGVFVQDFIADGGAAAPPRAVAGFSREYASESLGVSHDGRSITYSATFEQRTLKLLENLDLKYWR